MPKKANPLNATVCELPGAAGGTIQLGSTTRIHYGLQIGNQLVVEVTSTASNKLKKEYRLIAAGGSDELADAFAVALERSERRRPATKAEQRDWTRAAEWAEEQAPAAPARYSEDEQKLVDRYPGVKIVPGSLSRPGEETCFGKKRVCTISCVVCNASRVMATSDLFHCSMCPLHTKLAKAEARKARLKAKTIGK